MKRRRITIRLAHFWLALAGGLLSASLAPAQGTIVFVSPSQPISYSDVSPSQNIDINNDGVADFTLSGGQDVLLNALNNNAIISVPEPPGDLGAFIYALSQGAPISSSLDPVLAWWGTSGNGPSIIVSASNLGASGYFAYRTDPTYAGIRLDVGGALYYGWIHIENFYGSNWGQITDWAYETRPNTPIFAGEGAVPEPSTCALLSAGGILVWLLGRGKRMA